MTYESPLSAFEGEVISEVAFIIGPYPRYYTFIFERALFVFITMYYRTAQNYPSSILQNNKIIVP
jgi:hypothetical protein